MLAVGPEPLGTTHSLPPPGHSTGAEGQACGALAHALALGGKREPQEGAEDAFKIVLLWLLFHLRFCP